MFFNISKTIRHIWSNQVDLPFDVNEIEFDPKKPLKVQLDETFSEIKRVHSHDGEFIECIDKAYNGCKFLLEIAPLYDFDQERLANGYWTFAKIIAKFGKIVLLTSNEHNFKRDHTMHVFHILNTGVTICRKIRNKETYGDTMDGIDSSSLLGVNLFEEDSLFASKLDILDLLFLIKSMKQQLTSIYAYFNSFWLCPSISQAMQYFSTFMAIYSSQWKTLKVYNWANRHNRGIMFTNMSLNINIDCLQSMWNLTEYRIARSYMSRSGSSGFYSKSIYIPRQNRWKVGLFESKVYDQSVLQPNLSFGKCKKTFVRCLTMRSTEKYQNSKNKSVLIHIHGGGFISQSPEFHQSYLKDWITKLKDVTIISIDYSLSPESTYPEALQEVLDCYIWLTSNDSQVETTIGFYPDKIALCGDSAGGNLSMALLLVLMDIRNSLKQTENRNEAIRYPDGIFCYYTPFLLNTIVSPSRLISSIEGLMPVGALLSCIAAYIPQEVMLKNITGSQSSSVNKFEKQHSTTVDTYSSSTLFQMMADLYSKITTSLSNALIVKRTVPWYNKTDTVKQSLFNLNTFASNPFISPLLAKGYYDLKEIPLFLYPLTYDPFLDDSIEMAKRWKGKVHIEVIDGLPHGFLNLIRFSDKAKEASDKCIEHVLDVLG